MEMSTVKVREKKSGGEDSCHNETEIPDADSARPSSRWSIRSFRGPCGKHPSEQQIVPSPFDICTSVVIEAGFFHSPDHDLYDRPSDATAAARVSSSNSEDFAAWKCSPCDSMNVSLDYSTPWTEAAKQTTALTSVAVNPQKNTQLSRRLIYDLVIRNLTYKVNVRAGPHESKKKTLLNGVNAKARNSEILAIIGRSGSSKTTLLDALAGHIDASSLEGSILVNGVKMEDGLKSISGYVTQEDYLFPMLTTEETLMFSARLRLSSKITAIAKRERVQSLIDELGLASCAKTRVGNEKIRGISGGERRRLSIGVDLIHDPPVLLLDEPTSGLDSTSALQVIETLHSLAVRRRHTIVMTVHQPSFRILELIHSTLVLARGHVMYHGPVDKMVDHFNALDCPVPEHMNVVEFALDTIAEFEKKPDGLQTLIDLQKERTFPEVEDGPESNTTEAKRRYLFYNTSRRRKYATSFASELWVLSQRNFYNIFRTHTLFLTRVGLTILTSLILISLFSKSPISEKGIQQRQTFIIFTIAIMVFTSTEALPIFLLERQILVREKSRGAYRTSSYAAAHSLVVLPFLLFLAVLCTCMSYFVVGLVWKTSAAFFFMMVIFLVLAMSNAFVACVSAVAPNFTVALGVVGGISAYMFLFSGFFMTRKEIPWYWLWIHYASLFKYSYESLLANELTNREGTVWYHNLTSEDVTDKLLGGEVNQTLNVWIMVVFLLGYRLIFYLALRFYPRSLRQ
ncbi:hypothetical protein R1sor_017289 [Riccia sorocarpa]|uniref:ABC transporter domain-containing protein n=1 Tax=Riccia sorocarpa TaxID=122646 RepID=A0ABD3IAF1_9MARC